MILPINHVADWRYIRWHRKTQINKEVILENTTRVDQNYRVGDKILVKRKSAYKYKSPLKDSYEIFQMWTIVTITLLTGLVTLRMNTRKINPYKDTYIE